MDTKGGVPKLADCSIHETVSVSSNITLREAIAELKEKKIEALVVVEQDQVIGTISERDIVRSKLQSNTKLGNFVIRTPSLTLKQNLADAAILFLNTGLKSVPVVDSSKVVGIITDDKVIQCLAETELGRKPIKYMMTSKPVVLNPKDSIATALNKFHHKNISRAPVVDKKKLQGIITLHDIVTKIQAPKDRLKKGSVAGEKISMSSIKVEQLMTKQLILCEPGDSLSSVVEIIVDKKITALPVSVDKETLIGLVSKGDILRFFCDTLKPKYSIELEAEGLGEVDPFERSRVISELDAFLEKFGARASQGVLRIKLSFFKEHVKNRRLTRTQASLKVSSENFKADSKGWGAYASVKDALKNITRQYVAAGAKGKAKAR